MRIIEINALGNGAHNNQSYPGFVPDGWAVIPDDVETKNFPFGVPAIDYDHGVPTVVHWIPGVMPEPDPIPAPEPTAQDDTDAMLVDHEYRLTLLELGLV
jgi:hypothetical protein